MDSVRPSWIHPLNSTLRNAVGRLVPFEDRRLASARQPVAATIEIARCAEEAEQLAVQWDDLAAHASEPNVFFERWNLLEAMRAFGGEEVSLVFVRSVGHAGQPGELLGLFPVREQRGYHGLSIRHLSLWRHAQCFLGTPLVRAGREEDAIAAFLSWVDARREIRFFTFDHLVEDGNVCLALRRVLTRWRRSEGAIETFERAMIRSDLRASEYLAAALSGKRRKDIRRKETRLREQGVVASTTLSDGDDVGAWVREFLELERSGWKGELGSALAASEQERVYFERIATGAARRGALAMAKLTLDGRPIAMKVNFLSGTAAFAYKIAYDEEFARFSPGLLLEVANIDFVQSHPVIEWMDSCAIPDHFMINRLWTERRRMCNLAVGTGSAGNRIFFRAMSAGKSVYRNLKKRKDSYGDEAVD